MKNETTPQFGGKVAGTVFSESAKGMGMKIKKEGKETIAYPRNKMNEALKRAVETSPAHYNKKPISNGVGVR